jgi:hypothetical protein
MAGFFECCCSQERGVEGLKIAFSNDTLTNGHPTHCPKGPRRGAVEVFRGT